METYTDAIDDITTSVFATMLGIDLRRLPAAEPTEQPLMASIHIAGEWTGSVVLALSPAAAREAASAMLAIAPDAASQSDLEEVASELVNMIGGNVKGLLPGPSYLSLPTIVSGNQFGLRVIDAALIENIALASEAGPLWVRLYRKTLECAGRLPN